MFSPSTSTHVTRRSVSVIFAPPTKKSPGSPGDFCVGDPSGIRTRVTAVRGRRTRPLYDGAVYATVRLCHEPGIRTNHGRARQAACRRASRTVDSTHASHQVSPRRPHRPTSRERPSSSTPDRSPTRWSTSAMSSAIVLTHEHPDHWTPDHLDRLLKDSPEASDLRAGGRREGRGRLRHHRRASRRHRRRSSRSRCEFFGGKHAVIHETIPVVDNVGVLVNDEFYYPGDSYAVPKGADVKLLAAPLGAPWLKIGEAMDFVLAVAPRQAFGTHDMTPVGHRPRHGTAHACAGRSSRTAASSSSSTRASRPTSDLAPTRDDGCRGPRGSAASVVCAAIRRRDPSRAARRARRAPARRPRPRP